LNDRDIGLFGRDNDFVKFDTVGACPINQGIGFVLKLPVQIINPLLNGVGSFFGLSDILSLTELQVAYRGTPPVSRVSVRSSSSVGHPISPPRFGLS